MCKILYIAAVSYRAAVLFCIVNPLSFGLGKFWLCRLFAPNEAQRNARNQMHETTEPINLIFFLTEINHGVSSCFLQLLDKSCVVASSPLMLAI
ncbi:hypothetical protein BC830DRAFT_65358 [Chytriomyces sp. MP71]|nr:hypothetical protein BC830DRAFT_65358 [Chytriomyces sp. MP71]